MRLFGRKRQSDPFEVVTRLAIERFAAHGVTLAASGAGMDVVLSGTGPEQYPLHNLFLKCRDASPAEVEQIVAEHVDSIADAASMAPIEELSNADLLRQIRVRLTPIMPNDPLSLDYARPFADGLVVALCVDFPSTVKWVNDSDLAGHDIDALFQAGLDNVIAEQVDEVVEVAPGIIAIAGDSFFTASKAVAMDRIIGTALPPAPHGVVFGVPHREVILAHVLTGSESIEIIGAIAQLIARFAGPDAPGGALSSLTYFYIEGETQAIAGPTPEGGIAISPYGRFGSVLETLVAD